MSRIGNKIIDIPQNVKVTFLDGLFSAKAENKEESLLLGSHFDILIKRNPRAIAKVSIK